MAISCFDGYLTEGCKTCPDWKNDEHSIGCGAHFPIMQCPHFAKMFREREADALQDQEKVKE